MKSLLRRRSKQEESGKLAKYTTEARDEIDSYASLSSRLAQDLQTQINEMCAEEIYSEPWIELTKVVDRIATVVRAESSLRDLQEDDEEKSGERESKNSTLWDGDEAAIRFLLEGGKTNVLLRMLEAFKTAQRLALPDACHPSNIEPRLREAAQRLERGICSILHHALAHSEVAETIDLAVLFRTVCDAFEFAVSRPELFLGVEETENSLEGAGFTIVATLVAHFEREDEESRVMPIVLDAGVLAASIRHLIVNADRLSEADRAMGLVAVAHIVGAEDFGIHEDKYLPADADVENLVGLQAFVDEALDANPELRRALRPLSDEIARKSRASKK